MPYKGNRHDRFKMNDENEKPAKGDILETIERERYDKPQECIDALLELLKSLATAISPFHEEDNESGEQVI